MDWDIYGMEKLVEMISDIVDRYPGLRDKETPVDGADLVNDMTLVVAQLEEDGFFDE